jgi:hypothetical protein
MPASQAAPMVVVAVAAALVAGGGDVVHLRPMADGRWPMPV